MNLRIYTDGACEPNPGPGTWGFVVVNKSDCVFYEESGFDLETTNNRMEMLAIYKALLWIKTKNLHWDQVGIFTDSQLCMNTLTKWAIKWKKKNWKNKKNLDLVIPAFDLYNSIGPVSFTWVRGHSGDFWNEYVDQVCERRFSELYSLHSLNPVQ